MASVSLDSALGSASPSSPSPLSGSLPTRQSSNGGGAASSPLSASSPRAVVRPGVVEKPQLPLPAFVYVPSNQRYLFVGFCQIFAIWLLYTFTAYQIGVPWQVFLKLRNINANSTDEGVTTLQAFLLFLWIMPAYAILFPLSLSVTIIVKWVLIGRYKEGRHKLWSWYYFRWWFVQRITGLVPLVYFRGSVLMPLYARAMGMRLGSGVFLNSFNFEAWDLVEIGDEASIGCDSHISNFHVEHGYLTISRVTIGARAYVGARSIVQGSMGEDAHLGAMSLLSHGKTIPPGEAWRGSPAKRVGTVDNIYTRDDEEHEPEKKFTPIGAGYNSLSSGLLDKSGGGGGGKDSALGGAPSRSANQPEEDPSRDANRDHVEQFGRPSACRLFLFGLAQMSFICGGLSAIILVSAAPGLLVIHSVMSLPNSDLFPSVQLVPTVWMYVAVVPVMAVTFVLAFCLQIVVLKRIIMYRAEEGTYWIYSSWYLRKWMVDCLLQLSLHTVYTMYATMYLPPFLRALGATLGAGTEVSTAADYCPDMLTIGAGCFVADSVYLGVPVVYMSRVKLARVSVGEKTFLGNGACLSLDSHIGSDALLGVMSTPPPAVKPARDAIVTWPEGRTAIADSTSYLGSPPMLLPRRQQSQTTFDAASTFHPTRWLYAQRLTFEFFRIIMPFMFMSACMLMYMGNFEYLLFKYDDTYLGLTFFWMFIWPCCYVGAAFVCCFMVLLFKWILVGAYTPSEQPLWSNFVWRTELCVGLMEALGNPFFVNHIRGTPFVCMWFRLLGSTIGDRVWMDTTQITEPDLVVIGNDVVLQQDCTLQTHLFEDRIMKMSRLHIDNFCSVGTMSVLLYDSRMMEGSHIGDLSLLMKGESLEPWTRSEGVPCVPIRKEK